MAWNPADGNAVVKRSAAAIRLYRVLWKKRMGILQKYFKKKTGFFFMLRSGSVKNKASLAALLAELKPINEQEVRLLLVTKEMHEFIRSSAEHLVSDVQEHLVGAHLEVVNPAMLNDHAGAFLRLILTHQRFWVVHESILAHEARLIEQPSEDRMKAYLSGMQYLLAELRLVSESQQEFEDHKRALGYFSRDLDRLSELARKQQPGQIILVTAVATVVRVAPAFGGASATLDALGFEGTRMELMVVSGIISFILSFFDYFYGFFPWLTSQLVSVFNDAKFDASMAIRWFFPQKSLAHSAMPAPASP